MSNNIPNHLPNHLPISSSTPSSAPASSSPKSPSTEKNTADYTVALIYLSTYQPPIPQNVLKLTSQSLQDAYNKGTPITPELTLSTLQNSYASLHLTPPSLPAFTSQLDSLQNPPSNASPSRTPTNLLQILQQLDSFLSKSNRDTNRLLQSIENNSNLHQLLQLALQRLQSQEFQKNQDSTSHPKPLQNPNKFI